MYRHIIAAVDGSPSASHALQEAAQLARQMQAALTVVHLLDLQQLARGDHELIPLAESLAQARLHGQTLLAQACRQIQAAADIEVRHYLGECWHGKRDMAMVLTRFAREVDADLLVLATHGQGGMRHMLMGSFSEHVMRQASCPMMMVRYNPARASTPAPQTMSNA
ncbi:universal stress protein [Paludibacterium sp. B53371]|uniref:universal stress protein n=1 Tax=Paludibacterium sp. B53371 TaxID=2806263 RepID=UPI001C0475E5|nr:universal stress protein [Paludibacterium sp. B53371]